MYPEPPRPEQHSKNLRHVLDALGPLFPQLKVIDAFARRVALSSEEHSLGLLFRVDAAELLRRSRANEGWQSRLSASLEQFSSTLRAEHVLVAADRDGVILTSFGSPSWRALDGMLPGYLWSEAQMGPSGIGTALTEFCPVLIPGLHHYQLEGPAVVALGVPLTSNGELQGAVELRVPVEDLTTDLVKATLKL